MLELLLEIVVTDTEKQTAQSAMGADTPRDLMERLVQLEEESTRMQTTLRRKESPCLTTNCWANRKWSQENEGERSRLSSKRTVQLEAQNLHTA